jgi:hypothetical protein
LIKPLNMLWVDWKGNVISMWMAMWMFKRKAQPFTNAQFKSPWKRWVVKFEKTMLMTRNINSNSKSITSTNSHINNFFLLEKQNPFNERRTSCASFIIKWIIATFITKVPKEKQIVVGLGQFPMTLIDMIIHKHGDKAFAQYSNKFWTNDTISSLTCYYIR